MSEGTPGAGSDGATSLGGISLEDGIANLLGDGGFGSDDGESQASESTAAAGTPPAERLETSAESQPAPEGTVPAERAGTPPADAASPAPDAVPQADPLATATPFTYTVNGESRTFDGVKVLGDAGAIVMPEALDLLQRRLGERDHLFEQNREQYAKVQDYERLSAWQTKDAEGKDQTLQGREGLEAMRTSFATLQASFNTLVTAFTDPALFQSLVTVTPEGKIVPDPTNLRHLLTSADLAESRAREQVTAQIRALVGPQAAPAAQTAAPDFTAHAPAVITQAAGNLASHLTAEDRTTLAAQMPRYVRPVTEADRQQNATLRLGTPIVDVGFKQIVQALATVRSQAKATATATVSASAENAKRLAAAFAGKPAQTRAPVAPAPQPDTSRASDADKAWALRERMASGRFSS